MKEFKEYLEPIQSVSKEGINKNHKFAMVQSGGTLGELNRGFFLDRKKIIYTSDNKEELETKAKSWNKSRSKADISYYKIRYSVVPMIASKIKEKHE